ncbi:hypothetical protein GGH96_001607 [Coemansia sp. RSA 1972]|nr:hypothetical protein GGH96_001607 [Coemansia sp. RSA 1972]
MFQTIVASCGQLTREYRLPLDATIDDLSSYLEDDPLVARHCNYQPLQFMNSSRNTMLTSTDTLSSCTHEVKGKRTLYFGIPLMVSFVANEELLGNVAILSACSIDEALGLARIEHAWKVDGIAVEEPYSSQDGEGYEVPCYSIIVHCSER